MLKVLAQYLHLQAEAMRPVSVQLANGLHWLGDMAPHLENPLPNEGLCPECGGVMRVKERVCPAGNDYKAGYRAIWKCDECGEYELR